MSTEGDRNSERDSAASASARESAISAAMAEVENQGQGTEPSAAEPEPSQPSKAPDAGAKEPEVSADSTDASQGQAEPAVSTETQLEPPKNWPKDRQDAFNSLDDNAKRILLQRDKEYTQGIHKNAQENADHRKKSEALGETLGHYRDEMQAAGMDEIGAVRFMVQEREAFNRDPVAFVANFSQRAQGGLPAFVKALIERTGLTQDQLFAGQQPGQQTSEQGQADEWVDPMVLELRSEIQSLKGENQALKQNFGQFQNQFTQRENLTIQEEIQSFRSQADEGGNPVRPHFEDVKPIMQRLMDADPEIARIPDWKVQEKLQAAYDKAVWLVPEIRQQLIDSQVNQSVSSQLSQASIDKAKAAKTVRPSPGANGQAQLGKMSKADAVNSALREAGLA